uniref:NADH-ubiquinone oxidoreductase chain 3 n=1 Tax=Isorropodon fossajaponicum TaxID=1871144 RepID=A0A1B4WR28_9BIVA|nr:NADH dehydrogenase subunit 3 [Isorropodon fossajaponicum]
MALLVLGVMVSQNWRFEWAKLTSFECGFDPMSSSRSPFSMQFFLLALLFLIFDMEIVLLFPIVMSLKMVFCSMPMVGKSLTFLFLLILLGGLIHEFNEGTLDWVKG